MTENLRLKSMRVFLTENCNAKCSFCFNKDIRPNGDMDVNKAKRLFGYLSYNKVHTLLMLGGEPTTHPQFLELYNFAKEKFRTVILFTNAVNDKIEQIQPRNTDGIVYNISFIKDNFNFDKILPNFKNPISFETVISSNTNLNELSRKIKYIVSNINRKKIYKQVNFNLTLDCSEKIMENRLLLNDKFNFMMKFIFKIDSKLLSFDHAVPLCFWTKKNLEFFSKTESAKYYFYNTCTFDKVGLINSNFEIIHCNLYPEKVGDIFENETNNSRIISFNKLNTLLYKAYNKKLGLFLENEKCLDCLYAITKCKSGCYKID